MKRTLSVLLAALLVFAVAGNAPAYFENGLTLTQAVYKVGDKEVATSLALNTTNFNFSAPGTYNLSPVGSFALNKFSGTTNWSDLQVGIFTTRNQQPSGGQFEAWFVTTEQTNPTIKANKYSSFDAAASAVNTYYQSTSTQTANSSIAETQNYFSKMNSGNPGSAGQYGGYNSNFSIGETSLAALGTVGFADMYLYHFVNNAPVDSPLGTDYYGKVRLFADGHTELHVVPIPPAVLLLASGVIGLVGIRRRRSN